eukprot:362940-Chlamydomonas_euryale.AAC.4
MAAVGAALPYAQKIPNHACGQQHPRRPSACYALCMGGLSPTVPCTPSTQRDWDVCRCGVERRARKKTPSRKRDRRVGERERDRRGGGTRHREGRRASEDGQLEGLGP